ncbi:MAG: HEAT repeat domain-containing protein [Phycisphaerae bacterium]|nr:HEAT repeat domain-containing protein [Phycisphaerae bacterium]
MNHTGLRTIVVAVVVLFGACISLTQTKTAKRLTDVEQKEFNTLTGQLSDPSRSPKTKLEAAELLLAKQYPQAVEALKDFLAGDNLAARIAVAQAVSRSNGSAPKSDFIDPLLAMLTGSDAEVRPAAAKALAVYKDESVIDKLVAIVSDRKRERAVRIDTMAALQSTLDKRTVDALVRLLDDRDAPIRDAAADALANLTNIKAFRTNRRLAKQWWNRNRNKPPSKWLAELADSLARGKAELEVDNKRLRERLALALRDLYDAVPETKQESLLLGFLSDPVADARLAGTVLAGAKIAGGQEVSAKLQTRIRAMVKDPDPAVRQASVLLVAHQGDAEALGALLAGLKTEETQGVRQAIMTALGHLKSPEALPAVVVEIASNYDSVAGAAALALSRIASAKPLTGDVLAQAGSALVRRYKRKGQEDQAAAVAMREAVLTAMGVIRHKSFLSVLRSGLKDTEAAVRLAAVNSLAQAGQAADADAIAALVGDSDRGVRVASIATLGKLGGRKHLATILKRTDPKAETDQAVRKQAWEVAMGLLAHADAETLEAEAQRLAGRDDAINQRIEILEMLVAALKDSAKLPQALRTLGQALLAGARPAEAAGHFRKAYDAMLVAKDAKASEAWVEWIEALLAADDPAAVKAMVAQNESAVFSTARKALTDRLAALIKEERYAPAILLADRAVENLSQRLTVEERKSFQTALTDAREAQRVADKKKVSQLVGQLTAADEAARSKAAGELQVMASRAVVPLLEILKGSVEDKQSDPSVARAIIVVLKQVAPKLTGYDPEASKDQRIKVIEGWLEKAQA